MAISFIRFANIILAALLAGTSFGIWIGLNPLHYSASTYVEQQQQLVSSLNTLMVSLVVIATFITVASAYLHRRDRIVFIAFLLAAICFASCIIISRFGNLPIQTEMATWTVSSLPGNWTSLRDKWWSFHVARTVAELIALTLVTWAGVRKTTAG